MKYLIEKNSYKILTVSTSNLFQITEYHHQITHLTISFLNLSFCTAYITAIKAIFSKLCSCKNYFNVSVIIIISKNTPKRIFDKFWLSFFSN